MVRIFTLIIVTLTLVIGSIAVAKDGAITPSLIEQFQKDFEKNPDNDRIINAVANNKIKPLSLSQKALKDLDEFYDVSVKKSGIVNQRSSGRCWLFAGVNKLSPKIMSKLKLDDFEISEPYLTFYDKLEKANYYLERIIEMRDRPIDDRSLSGEIRYMFGDGGWWHYFNDLVRKYGIVPLEAMPETKQSVSTGMLNKLGKMLLRSFTAELRKMHTDGKKESDLRKRKEEMLSEMYTFLVYNYGQPPEEFVFRYEYEQENEEDSTETKKELIEKSYTPQSFYAEFFPGTTEYVAITNVPTKAYQQLYTLEESRNIYETDDFQVLNMPIEKLKEYTLKSLIDSQLVWFACDVGHDNYNDTGVFKAGIYDYNTTFDIDFSMTKHDRIMYGDVVPSHAMVITACDTIADGSYRKWQVENSWGTKPGDSGLWEMYDNWFDEYVLLVIVDKALLSDSDKAMFDMEPKTIKDWEPFFQQLRNLE